MCVCETAAILFYTFEMHEHIFSLQESVLYILISIFIIQAQQNACFFVETGIFFPLIFLWLCLHHYKYTGCDYFNIHIKICLHNLQMITLYFIFGFNSNLIVNFHFSCFLFFVFVNMNHPPRWKRLNVENIVFFTFYSLLHIAYYSNLEAFACNDFASHYLMLFYAILCYFA